MKKIALVILKEELKDWSGGISYYVNFLKILENLQNIKIIIYTDSKRFIKDKIKPKKAIVFQENFFVKNSLFFFIRKIVIFIFKKDFLLYQKLILDKIDILTHRRLFLNNEIKCFGWIPDLQHRIFKKMFLNNTYVKREKYVLSEISKSDFIFVSSKQVRKEFRKFYNLSEKIIPLIIPLKIEKLKYVNRKKFILFPSQFWKHKNHIFLIKVAKILKEKKINIKFIFCGKTKDYRNKDYFNKIKNEIFKNDLDDYIKILGEVNKQKLYKLQRESLAMINCSLYEGWSTINEEAKKLNKFIFLSKIKGHLEQKNPGSIYFNLKSPEELSRKIINFIKSKKFIKDKILYSKNLKLYKKNIRIAEENLIKYYKL